MLLLPRPLLSRTLAREQADEDRIRQACSDGNVNGNKSLYSANCFESLLQGIPRANVTTPMKRRRCVERPAAVFGDSCTLQLQRQVYLAMLSSFQLLATVNLTWVHAGNTKAESSAGASCN